LADRFALVRTWSTDPLPDVVALLHVFAERTKKARTLLH
jgi:hypothetical protein